MKKRQNCTARQSFRRKHRNQRWKDCSSTECWRRARSSKGYRCKRKLCIPGIIDCHAHLNEPGFEYREDFETGSRAAVVAGCTTLIDMPLNNDPSLMNKEIFDLKAWKN